MARSYLQGMASFVEGDPHAAAANFAMAYLAAPGKALTALAYAVAIEATHDRNRFEEAADLYEQVAVTDPSWVAAVAGLARVLHAIGRQSDAAPRARRRPRQPPVAG